jgi:hypothetical protein
MRTIMMKKWEADAIHGGLTTTSKMPSKSYSTPTALCVTGFEMAKIPGSLCSVCYAQRNNYHRYQNGIEPAQHARYEAMLYDPQWAAAMVASIAYDLYFRWFDSGDIPSLEALESIVEVCRATPRTLHWLPTREYGMVKAYIAKYGRDSIPDNLVIRLSAMFPDRPAVVPLSLQGIKNVLTSNVHTDGHLPTGSECGAPKRGNKCGQCRDCWDTAVEAVSYHKH